MAQQSRPLSRERIIKQSLALIEEKGLGAFSLRKLAASLQCEAMSLYHHFANKDAILNAVADSLIGEISLPDINTPPQEQLKAIARDWRRLALSYPCFFRYLGLHRLNSEAGVRFLNHIMAVLEQTGLEERDAARLFRVVNYFLLGAGLDETMGYAQGPSSDSPVSDARIAQDFPALARAGKYFNESEMDQIFEYGLCLLLTPCTHTHSAST